MTAPRVIDHLCPAHVDMAMNRWNIAGNLGALFDQCPRCDAIASGLHPTDSYTVRVLPNLDPRTYEEGEAFHEAAHAVLGLAVGMPLEYVRIKRRDGDSEMGGHAKFGPYSVPGDRWAAQCWAGARAHLRWLQAVNLATDANVADVVYMGWHDTQRVLEACEQYGWSTDIGWDLADDLLQQWWRGVEDVAFALAQRLHLTGAEVEEITAHAGLRGCP